MSFNRNLSAPLSETSQLGILHSAEEENLSPFDSRMCHKEIKGSFIVGAIYRDVAMRHNDAQPEMASAPIININKTGIFVDFY